MQLALSFFLLAQLILIIWLVVISVVLYRWYATYKQLTQDINQKDFGQVLEKLLNNDKFSKTELELVHKKLAILDTELKPHIQKIGFVRYNPFGNTGGDQSFSLCLLDGRGDGVLLTSLHARQSTRIYTKEIINNSAKDGAQLSKEEKECLKNAHKWS